MERKTLTIRTAEKREVVAITEIVQNAISEIGAADGLCALFLTHTTGALTTVDLDPGTDLDMLDAFEALIPKLPYRHPHNPEHVPDHILSSLIGTSLAVPFQEGKLLLGQWQEVVLIELDGPRERTIVASVMTSS